jgi:uncharacterized LabA/DUF88 family protein
MDERVAIFIDGSNLYHALKDNFARADINFAEFTRKLSGERALFRIYYYNVLQDPGQRPDGAREQQEFFDQLRKIPYMELRLGGTKLSQGVTVEKGIDIMLASDVVNFAWRNMYDVAIIVSGDSDFAYALKMVKDLGKHIEVANFESNVSKDLIETADYRHILDRQFFSGIWSTIPAARPINRPRRRRSRGLAVRAPINQPGTVLTEIHPQPGNTLAPPSLTTPVVQPPPTLP